MLQVQRPSSSQVDQPDTSVAWQLPHVLPASNASCTDCEKIKSGTSRRLAKRFWMEHRGSVGEIGECPPLCRSTGSRTTGPCCPCRAASGASSSQRRSPCRSRRRRTRGRGRRLFSEALDADRLVRFDLAGAPLACLVSAAIGDRADQLDALRRILLGLALHARVGHMR